MIYEKLAQEVLFLGENATNVFNRNYPYFKCKIKSFERSEEFEGVLPSYLQFYLGCGFVVLCTAFIWCCSKTKT
jgi:hypothetical protein